MKDELENMHAGATKDKFTFAAYLRKRMTPQEQIMWQYLRTKPFNLKFRRQHPFKDYVLDFYCHKLKISIEIDGKIHLSQKEYDKDRTEVLKEYGISELRFTNVEVTNNFNEVKVKLSTFIQDKKLRKTTL